MLAAGRYHASQLAARLFVCSPVGRIRDISYVLSAAYFTRNGAGAHVEVRRTSFREYQCRPSCILKGRLRAELSLALSGHSDELTGKVSKAHL